MYRGLTIGAIKGDTRSLDNSSCEGTWRYDYWYGIFLLRAQATSSTTLRGTADLQSSRAMRNGVGLSQHIQMGVPELGVLVKGLHNKDYSTLMYFGVYMGIVPKIVALCGYR